MTEPGNWITTLSPERLRLVAERLKQKKRVAGEAVEIRAVRASSTYPLSFAQERLWFLDQLEPGTSFYNIPAAVRLRGAVLLPALAGSLAELIRRHDSLRTTFGDEGGKPFQQVASGNPFSLPLVDLEGLPAARREDELERLATIEVRRPFDLARGPLIRTVLYRLAAIDHTIVYTLHHIISDGWSSGVFQREVAELYTAFAAGRPSPLAPPAIQYGDYAVWQRKRLAGDFLAAELAYWRERLTGVPGLELPTDRPRPAVETFRGTSRELELGEELTGGLYELARREGASLFMVLLAAFDVVLHRATGQSDIAVGSPIANRNRREAEGVIGFFANTVVLRADLGGDPTFRELLDRVKETTLGAYDHEELPFERIVEDLQPQRDMSRNPLFQVMCVLQNQPRRSLPAGDLVLEPLHLDLGSAKFDLTIFWFEEGSHLRSLIEHNSDLFDQATVLRFFRRYEGLLAEVSASPAGMERRLSELALPGAAERQQLLYEWNDTARDEGEEADERGLCVHRWVERVAAQIPAEPAAVFYDRRLTYAELDARANRLARGLARRGVGPESLVGVCLERSLGMVVAALGVLKAGGALVALDPAYPRERLATIIEDAGLAVLLTEESLLRHFPGHEGIAVTLEGDAEPFPEESSQGYDGGALPDHPMYAIYTSGSTGQPKGILVPHRAFANLISWQLAAGGTSAGAGVKTVQFATFGFCVSFQEIFSAWCSGGTLAVADEMTRRDVESLGGFLESSGIERLHLPYAALKHLADSSGTGSGLPVGLKEVVTAGEQLRVTPAVESLFDRLPGCTLSNQYGASETHVVSALTLSGPPSSWPAIPPVGRPIAEVRIHLLDGALQPVPIGVRGELYAGGACVARGYLNDPVLTAQKTIPDPFGTAPGGRLYRTGDLARHLANGEIEHLGRVDGQVKVRGFRVELGEVETVLSRHPGVRDVAVVAVVAVAGKEGPRLAAYVVSEEGWAWRAEELRQHLKERLPEHMVPAAFVPMGSLPVNANGKLDQAALPAPEGAFAGESGRTYVAPRTPIEEVLAGVWSEVLGVPRVGSGDDFFELGGHSLLATQVVSRARAALGVELPVRRLFEAPVLADLAARIEEEVARSRRIGRGTPPILPAPRMRERDRVVELPLSFAQERLWFLDRLQPGSSFYNMPLALRLRGRLVVPALATGFDALIARHEALRTTFAAVDGRPVQVVATAGSLRGPALPLVDLAGLPGEQRESTARELAGGEAARPFDLAQGPLVRAALLRLGPADHLALFTMHHIVSDGWSLGVLVREMGELYAALSQGRAPVLAPLPVQYADFALWQRSWLTGDVLAEQLGYWRQRLAGAPAVLDLPLDRPRPAMQSFRGGRVTFRLPAELSRRVAAFGRSRSIGATSFMTLLAAFAALLGRLSGQGDVVVGTPVANRNRVETEGLIGFFVNTLALRVRLPGAKVGLGALLADVREATISAYAHQDLPFERLVEELQPARSLAWSPLFQVMLSLLNAPLQALELPGLALEMVDGEGEETGAKFDLTLSLTEGPQGFAGSWEYDRDLFDAATVHRLASQLERLLAAALAVLDRTAPGLPEPPLAELPLLSPGEAQQLVEWGETAPPATHPALLLARVEAAAAAVPETVALVGGELGEERLSYGELLRRAHRLARHLRAQGVGPGTLVGVCLERTPQMVTALLAVLAAGGAYLPLDPAYPPERLTFLQEDARAGLTIVTAGTAGRIAGRKLDLDVDRAVIARHPAVAPVEKPAPGDLAYVLYTSGSTGRPKGVAVEHRSVAALLAWAGQAFPPADLAGVLAATSIAFDLSVFELFAPLAHGGRAILAPNALHLPNLAAAGEVTLVNTVPSVLAELLRHADLPPAVRTVNLAGEALPGALVAAVFERSRAGRVLNLYGPSEDTTYSTFALLPRAAGAPLAPPIGRPLPGTSVHLLDAGLFPVPAGVVGEICLAGAGLARGYLHRPELTAERFLPDPSARVPGDRLYRTGDLGRYRPGGELEFLGRRDQQVKLRGFRIEPGEIEAALTAHPEVREAAVVLREGAGGEQELAAFVVLQRAGDLQPGDLQAGMRAGILAALAARLPAFMVPSALTALPALPRNANGKIDRQALANLARPTGTAAAREAPVPPRDALELRLASLWEDLLKTGPLGVRDSFFDLGGHSLLAVRLLAQIERDLGTSLPLPIIFQAPTIERLATVLRERGTNPIPFSLLVHLNGDPSDGGREGGVGARTERNCLSPQGEFEHRPQPDPALPTAAGPIERPFFCVHPIGGSVFCYRDLARRLDGRPFYGLQSRGLTGEPPQETIPEMAAAYIEAIREAQPAGPYLLGGWSFGGLVAFEMACQLERQGQRVERLALLDPTPVGLIPSAERPGGVDGTSLDEVSALLLLAQDLGGMTGRPLDLAADELAGRDPESRLDLLLERARASGGLPPEADSSHLRHLLRLCQANLRAAFSYVPGVCNAPVTLLQTAESASAGRSLAWERLAAGGLDLRTLPGDHYSLLREPHLARWSEELDDCLAKIVLYR